MDTNIVPVTEAEMRGIAERLISTVVGYSRQASELEEIKSRVSSLSDQVSALRGENATLKTERDDALNLAVENEAKLNDARRHRDDLLQRNTVLNENIVSRDSRVKELEGLLTSARLEGEDWQRKCAYAERVEADLRNQLSTVRERRDHWTIVAEDALRDLSEANTKLAAIEKQVQDVFGLVKPPQAQEVPTQADPMSGTLGPSSVDTKTEGSTSSSTSTKATKPWWEAETKVAS